jgi:hypothetical protein
MHFSTAGEELSTGLGEKSEMREREREREIGR